MPTKREQLVAQLRLDLTERAKGLPKSALGVLGLEAGRNTDLLQFVHLMWEMQWWREKAVELAEAQKEPNVCKDKNDEVGSWEQLGVYTTVDRSSVDGTVVVFVDTPELPENSDGPLLRIHLNDSPIWENPPYPLHTVECKLCVNQVEASSAHLHDSEYVGAHCGCWDSRLKQTE